MMSEGDRSFDTDSIRKLNTSPASKRAIRFLDQSSLTSVNDLKNLRRSQNLMMAKELPEWTEDSI
jgi:hypothetical protein